MNEKLQVTTEFWKHAEQQAAATVARADEALRFNLGALSALTVWLATHQPTEPLLAFFPLAMGVVGAGYLTHLHLRAARYQAVARELANTVRLLVDVPISDWPYADRFAPKNIFAPGHPVTGPLFGILATLVLAGVYSYVLLSLR